MLPTHSSNCLINRVFENGVEKKSAPTLHYSWIGGPDGTNVEGHDIKGPIQMAKQNSVNPIKFWCLENYIHQFELKLKGNNVEVCSIEAILHQTIQNTDNKVIADYAKMLQKHIPSLYELSCTTKDRVIFHDLISVFLVTVLGGYKLDTNIMPSNADLISLPYFAEMQFPYVEVSEEEARVFNLMYPDIIKKGKYMPDCFFLYAPENNTSKESEIAFLAHVMDYYDSLTNVFKIKKDSPEYIELFCNMLPQAIYSLYDISFKEHQGLFESKERENDNGFGVRFYEDIGIKKIFYRTHISFTPEAAQTTPTPSPTPLNH